MKKQSENEKTELEQIDELKRKFLKDTSKCNMSCAVLMTDNVRPESLNAAEFTSKASSNSESASLGSNGFNNCIIDLIIILFIKRFSR
jgi:hypothetical protein